MATIKKEVTTEQGNVLVSEPQEEIVADPQPVKVPCVVSVGASQTIPTGAYSSVKLSVHLSVTVEPGDIEEAFDQVKDWVGEKLGSTVEEALSSLGGENGEAGSND